MIGRDSIVEMSSSAVSLSRANVVGDAIGGASDITGNAGTIIVGSYRTIRASASDGTCIRIGRHVLPYRPIRVSNSHLRAAEWREHETLWCLVECGRYCGSRWQRCGYLRVWFRKGATFVRNLLQGLYLLVVLSRVVSRVVHLVVRLLTQLCEKEELVGVVSHILEAGWLVRFEFVSGVGVDIVLYLVVGNGRTGLRPPQSDVLRAKILVAHGVAGRVEVKPDVKLVILNGLGG